MADFKIKYPVSSTQVITISLASLADDDTNGIAGRASSAVDNTSTVDLDHLVTGHIKLGTSPNAGKFVEIFAYAAESMASGTPTYPDGITGIDASKTMTSLNVKNYTLLQLGTPVTDAVTGRVLNLPPTSIARLFGSLPPFWGLFIVNRSGVALDSTPGNHVFQYHRIQSQSA